MSFGVLKITGWESATSDNKIDLFKLYCKIKIIIFDYLSYFFDKWLHFNRFVVGYFVSLVGILRIRKSLNYCWGFFFTLLQNAVSSHAYTNKLTPNRNLSARALQLNFNTNITTKLAKEARQSCTINEIISHEIIKTFAGQFFISATKNVGESKILSRAFLHLEKADVQTSSI